MIDPNDFHTPPATARPPGYYAQPQQAQVNQGVQVADNSGMITLEIEGREVEVDASFRDMSPEQQSATVDEIAAQMGIGASQQANASPEPNQGQGGATLGHKIGATIDGVAQGMTFGFSDEIAAGLGTGFGYLGDYDKALEAERARMQENSDKAGGYELAGNIVGGLTTAGGLAKSGATLMGRGLGTKAAIGEGAAYGGLFGAGTSEEGERLSGATTGAITGAVTGGVLDKVGRGVSNKLAQRKIAKMPAPTVDDLAAQANQLYSKAEQAGINIKPTAMKRLGNNVMLSAGRLNDKLRPKTAGIVEDFADMMNRPVSLKEFDEMRQVVGQAMKRAEPQDVRTLTLIKNQMDNFADQIKPGDITGDIRGFDLIKQGRAIYAKKAKSDVIEKIFDLAELDTSQYTQSGIANTLTKRFRQLAKNDKQMKMFSQEEQEAIRKIAMGGDVSTLTKWLSKFAPRGVVSTMLGMGGGGLLGGPIAGFALPAAGHLAAKSVDRSAINAANALRGNVARGAAPNVKRLPNLARPFIPLGAQAAGTLSSQ